MTSSALVQSQLYFTPSTKEKYLGNIPVLTSTNVREIYNFIKINYCKHCIYKYVLLIDSSVLNKFIDYIYVKRIHSTSAKALLSKCVFVATCSNVDSVRQNNIDKKTNIYFSLSPLSKLLLGLNGVPQNVLMLVVSDTKNLYYDQIYSTNINPKYRIAELTVDKINEFAGNGGNTIIIALSTLEEYTHMTTLILRSKFTGALNAIELVYKKTLKPLFAKLSSISTTSSAVGICGNINKYSELNKYILYYNCSAVLVNSYKTWSDLIKTNVLTIESPNYNVSAAYTVIKQ